MWSKGDFRAIPEIAEKPQMPVCQGGSGVLALAGRMDADTLPNHALYHLSYTRKEVFQKRSYYNGFWANCKGKDGDRGRALVFFMDL